MFVCFACGDDGVALPPCGEDGLQLWEPAESVADQRYNAVLQGLLDDLHAGVGRYVDGSLPAYRGTVTATQRIVSKHFEQMSAGSGEAYAVVVDDSASLWSEEGRYEDVPVRSLRIYVPDGEFSTSLAEDPRAPGIALQGQQGTACTGTVTSYLAAPTRLRLDRVTCTREEGYNTVTVELDGELELLAPAAITFTDLQMLRKVHVLSPLPELGEADADGAVLVREVESSHRIVEGPGCYDEIDYRAVTYVHTDCLASHGVAELAIGEARNCCCPGEHCRPHEYQCAPL